MSEPFQRNWKRNAGFWEPEESNIEASITHTLQKGLSQRHYNHSSPDFHKDLPPTPDEFQPKPRSTPKFQLPSMRSFKNLRQRTLKSSLNSNTSGNNCGFWYTVEQSQELSSPTYEPRATQKPSCRMTEPWSDDEFSQPQVSRSPGLLHETQSKEPSSYREEPNSTSRPKSASLVYHSSPRASLSSERSDRSEPPVLKPFRASAFGPPLELDFRKSKIDSKYSPGIRRKSRRVVVWRA